MGLQSGAETHGPTRQLETGLRTHSYPGDGLPPPAAKTLPELPSPQTRGHRPPRMRDLARIRHTSEVLAGNKPAYGRREPEPPSDPLEETSADPPHPDPPQPCSAKHSEFKYEGGVPPGKQGCASATALPSARNAPRSGPHPSPLRRFPGRPGSAATGAPRPRARETSPPPQTAGSPPN